MPTLLCEVAFYGLTDPTYIFLDFAAHADLFQVMIFLGKANYGLIAPTKRQARAYLREIMNEDREIVPYHAPMRTLLLSRIEAMCDWRSDRRLLADICREVSMASVRRVLPSVVSFVTCDDEVMVYHRCSGYNEASKLRYDAR